MNIHPLTGLPTRKGWAVRSSTRKVWLCWTQGGAQRQANRCAEAHPNYYYSVERLERKSC